MGPWTRRTEERFEEWFRVRLDRWVNERFSAEFNERLKAGGDSQFQKRFEVLFASLFDERVKAWADSQFQDRFEALFTAGFNSRINAWKDTELKTGFNAWVEHLFDDLFTVWANTWADSADFQERFVRNFDARFEERLVSEVKARVANEVNTLIDKRIEQWLQAVRKDLIEAASPDPAQPGNDATQHDAPAGVPATEGLATAAELAAYLAKGPLQTQQIRRLLKGKEIPGRSPTAYPLGEAASVLLTRRGRQAQTNAPDDPGPRRDAPDS
jgi:hypothetical protein